ncbi:MAG TPA: hypothetical protein PLZ77_04050 [Lachnospiraceae bacterium]|nr:hypothetical protein [Lachnospiraceae bacterium]
MEEQMRNLNKNDNPFPWNDSSIVEEAYQGNNYQIVETGFRTNRCIIFFSGNGLYYPNNQDVFLDVVCKRDRYEWKKVAQNKKIREYFEKIIFVRDIYKQWYIKGTGSNNSSIKAVLDLLKENTENMQLTTCGNSAGGYMATLMGSLLGASMFFLFPASLIYGIKLRKVR